MNKKLLSIVCAAAISITSFVGCSASSSTTSSSKNAGQPVSITMFNSKVEIQDQLIKAADTFNKSQSGVKITILGTAGDNYTTNLQTQFASTPEKAPTIFQTAAGPEQDRFLKFMAPLDSAKASKVIAPGLADDATVDGKLYGLPTTVEGFGLIYNKSLFQTANVDPASIKSVDDLVNACKALEKVKGVTHALAFAKETYFTFMHPFNWGFAVMKDYKTQIDKVNKGEETLNDVSGVKQFALDLDKIKPYTNKALDSYDDQVAGFAAGKFAMIHQGSWVQPVLDQDKVSFEYGMMPFPTQGNDSISIGVPGYYRVNKYATADQQKGAIQFLDWLFTDKAGQDYYVNQFKLIPAYTGMASPSAELSKQVADYTTSGKTLPWTFTLFPSGIDKDGASQMQRYYAGQINSTQLLEELTKVWVGLVK